MMRTLHPKKTLKNFRRIAVVEIDILQGPRNSYALPGGRAIGRTRIAPMDERFLVLFFKKEQKERASF